MSSLLCVARLATSGKYCSRESEKRLLDLIIAHDHLRDKIISPNWIIFFLYYYNPNNNTGRSFLAIVHKVSLPGCLVETFAPIIHRAQWDQTSNQREMDAMCLRIPPEISKQFNSVWFAALCWEYTVTWQPYVKAFLKFLSEIRHS